MPFDAHIHLDHYEPRERADMLASAFAQGVEGVVAVSMDMDSCLANRRIAGQYPGRILPAYGHHPEQPPLEAEELERMCAWIAGLPRAEAFAIGEVGLPYFTRHEAEAAGQPFDGAPYIRQFERFVRLAAALDRPLALHAVHEDADAALDALERYGVKRAHFHWFKGSPATADRLARSGRYVSVTPEALYEEETRHLARTYPLDLLLVETDGPWPFEGPYAGRRTEPAMVLDSVRAIAELRGMPEPSVREALLANAMRCYSFGDLPKV